MESIFQELAVLMPLVLLVSIRTGVAFAALPAPLGSQAPTVVRAALGIMVAAVITLPYRTQMPSIAIDPIAMGFAALGELLLGSAIGLTARAAITSAEAAGELIAGSMGLGFAQSMDPNSGEHTSLPSQALLAVAIVLFFALHGHHAVLAALSASLRVAPPGVAVASMAAGEGLLTVGVHVLADGLRIASPIVASMLVVQLAVGLVARAAPRIQIFTLSFATAATLGLFALGIAAPSMLEAIASIVGAIPDRIDAALAGLG